MDIKSKIIRALVQELKAEYIRLEDDDGISGFVVTPQFKGVSSLDRQGQIRDALDKAAVPLTAGERRRVLMIAGRTPIEYQAVGAPIVVHSVKELPGGNLEIVLRGSVSDAEYVRGVLNNHKGIWTSEPKQVAGMIGVYVSFRAKGTEAVRLTKKKIVLFLKNDPYIKVMEDA
jgi:hypothetical protein